MKKAVLFVSIAIIAAFGVAAISSLLPDSSREGAGTFIPTEVSTPGSAENSPSTQPTETTEEPSQTPSATTPSVTPATTSTPTLIPTPTPTVKPTFFWISGSIETKEFKYDSKTIATVSFYIPRVSCNNEISSIDKINSYLKEEADELLEGYYAECNQYVDDYDPMIPEKLNYTSTAKLHFTDSIISIRQQVDISYGFGSGDQAVFCYNFSRETGELLSLDDVVNDKPALIKKAIEVCENMKDIEFSSNYKSYINTKICNEWYIKDGILYLVYKPYEIASGVAGTVEIPVSGDFININN